jgi:hypothetical protein
MANKPELSIPEDRFSVFSLNPAITVNQYLWYTLLEINPDLDLDYGTIIPFFPIADFGSGFDWAEQGKPYVLYDRMIRMRYNEFYPSKRDHFIYAIKGQDTDLMAWSSAIQYILDRQDDAAQDINEWNANPEKWFPETGKTQADPFYFHKLKVYQTESDQPRDWSVRSNYVSEFIVEACYHTYWSFDDLLNDARKNS